MRLLRWLMAKAAACSGPGLAAAAVAAPSAVSGGCDCGSGLCNSCCCWRPLRLRAGSVCGHCCSWLSSQLRLPVLQLRLLPMTAELRLRLCLEWPLRLASAMDAAACGYGCCLAAAVLPLWKTAPAVADGWGQLGVRRGQLI